MQYFSTRDRSMQVSAAKAIASGLAPEGGLYVPECIPQLTQEDLKQLCHMDYQARASYIMGLYLDEFSKEELDLFVSKAYADNYRNKDIAPVHKLDATTGILELFHGPTCAFKDMALQMLPHLLTASLKKTGEDREVCILVATSGDTGKAALDGFADVSGTRIIVFYPKDGVSDVQKLQMITQKGENVLVSSVVGNFDDAQTGVKHIFGDGDFAAVLDQKGYFLSSANSINWGRLLPQIVYYISAYCDSISNGTIALGEEMHFCVPTGNFGNILAGFYANRMGLPIGRLICASNENNVLTDFIQNGVYDRNRAFHTTISPSMDILVSSNLERLLYHISQKDSEVRSCMDQLVKEGKYTVSEAVLEQIQAKFSSGYCTDQETKLQIQKIWKEKDYLMDTHTAVASKVLEEYRKKTGDTTPTVIVSTASPYKFADSVLSALDTAETDLSGTQQIVSLENITGVSAPAPLKNLDEHPVRFTGVCQKEDMQRVVAEFLM